MILVTCRKFTYEFLVVTPGNLDFTCGSILVTCENSDFTCGSTKLTYTTNHFQKNEPNKSSFI